MKKVKSKLKGKDWQNVLEKEKPHDPTVCCLQDTLYIERCKKVESRRMEKISNAHGNQKRSRLTT